MTIRWKAVGWMGSALVVAALALCGLSLVAQRDRQAGLEQAHEVAPLIPLATGFGSVSGPVDPRLHCITLPAGMRLAQQPTSKAWMDERFHGTEDWTVISDRMVSGDNLYAYTNTPHPPPGATEFTGHGGGYVVLRGSCLVGRFQTWVE